MVKTTNDTKLCQEYLCNHLENLIKQLRQCQTELTKQSQSCPLTSLSLDQIDHCLKGYVHSERNYLFTRNTNKLMKLKDHIHEQDLHQTIVFYQLNMNLVSK